MDKESQNRKSENDPSYLSWLFAFVSPVTGRNKRFAETRSSNEV